MMHLPKFNYLRPSTIDEAANLLKEHNSLARVAAGGTDLFPRLKYGLEHPEVIISLKNIAAPPPSESPDGILQIDALTRLSDVTRSPIIQEKAPLLVKAAAQVASEEIRNMGTLGGNLCQESRCLYYNQSHSFQFVEPCFKRGGKHCYFLKKGKKCLAVYMADTAPALISLDAKIRIISPNVERELPIEELYSGDAIDPLSIDSNEIIKQIMIPSQPTGSGWAFKKFSLRGGIEFAALNVAVTFHMDNSGQRCEQARITAGAIAASPVRAKKAEIHLKSKAISDSLFEESANLAVDEIIVIPHHGYSRIYLKEILKVEIKRALKTAYNRTQKQELGIVGLKTGKGET